MSPELCISASSNPYPAAPSAQSSRVSPSDAVDDAALKAEDILARPRRAAQFHPGKYTIFAPPSDSEDGYEFYGDSELDKDEASDFEPDKRPAKRPRSQPATEPEPVADVINAATKDESEKTSGNTQPRATNLRDPPCHRCSWVSCVMIQKPVRLCEPYNDELCLYCASHPGECRPLSARALPLVERMYYAYEFSGVDSPEFTEARSIAATQILDDFLERQGKVRRNGRRTVHRGLTQLGRGGSSSSNGRGVGRGRAASAPRARHAAGSAEPLEPDREVVVRSSLGRLVNYDSDEPTVTSPQRPLPLVPYIHARQANHTQNVAATPARDFQVSGVRPPHLQTLEPLPEPMKGIVRKVMGIMEEQYGVPDTGTRDRMLAMGIRVSIEMALHFDPTLAYVLSMAASGRD